jgi:uncharacterized protein YkwD
VTANALNLRQLRGPLLGAAVACVAALSLTAPAPAAAAKCENQNATPGSVSAGKAERATLCLLNKQRRKHDVSKLRRHRDLDKPSVAHSRLMVRDKCFEHVCPGEDDLVDRLEDYLAKGGRGYGENIAWGTGDFATPRAIVGGWMKSEGHRRNILDRDFEHIGIGIVWGSPEPGVEGSDAGTYTTDFGFRDD